MTTLETIKSELMGITGEFPMFTGDNDVADGEFDEAIQRAVNKFSRDVPRTIVADAVGDGGNYYILTTILTSWEDGFSNILSIDYDAGTRVSSDELPQFLDFDDGAWKFYEDASSKYLLFPSLAPTSSITFRVRYTARHTLDNNQDTSLASTIEIRYEKAIIYLGISEVAAAVAFRLEKSLDPPAGVEFSLMRNRASGMNRLAEIFEEKYRDEVGAISGVIPAAVERDFDLTYLGGEQYMFHDGSIR